MLSNLLLSLLPAASAAAVGVNLQPRWQPGMMPIRGVNLGSQFIIEPWMAYDEWNSMGCGDAGDEWTCVQNLGQSKANAAFKKHWDTWTTQADIKKIKSLNLNTIRIPVGYWIHEELVTGDEHWPQGGLPYLDRLVGWASDEGLQIVIDLHGAPGSQSPDQSFTGHSTKVPGFYTQANYERACKFLEWMAERVHTKHEYRNVYALEVLNEPIRRDHQIDGSTETAVRMADDMVKNFYPRAWKRIRDREAQLGTREQDYLHIMFMGAGWGSGDPAAHLPADARFAAFDDHRYFVWGEQPATRAEHLERACERRGGVGGGVVGEWSIQVQRDGAPEFAVASPPTTGQRDFYARFWAAQAQAYERDAGGWLFWAWKCNWIGGHDEWRWCYESAVDNGVIPRDAASAKSIHTC